MPTHEIRTFIADRYADLVVLEDEGDLFFCYDPTGSSEASQRQPFATVVASDRHDATPVSWLDETGRCRLNLGVRRETYEARFGPRPAGFDTPAGYDYAEADVLLPHPTYASMSWVAVVDPSPATLVELRPLLDEAYGIARTTHDRAIRRAADPG